MLPNLSIEPDVVWMALHATGIGSGRPLMFGRRARLEW
jgi:hypothetical protein